jgi:hypothetical protein
VVLWDSFKKGAPSGDDTLFLKIWFAVMFVFFSIALGKRPVYLLPLYAALAILMAKWFVGHNGAAGGRSYYYRAVALLAGFTGVILLLVVAGELWNRDSGFLFGSIEQFLKPKDRANFVEAVKKACRIAKILNKHGVRKYGIIRIDSADSPAHWDSDPKGNTKKIAATFREAAHVAKDNGERLAAEGEICWAAMHSWKNMLDLLNEVGMPETVGFQADQAHTYLYLLGINAEDHALLKPGYSPAEFDAAFTKMTDALRPWTIDFHVAQNDGTVHGTGSHEKTGRHCPADDPNGKLDIVKTAGYWLKDAASRSLRHICWDGCMFPNAMLENQQTWNTILATMIKVRDAHGWN